MEDTTLPAFMDGLYAYGMVLSRNQTMAADLVQETYLRALKAKESLRPDSKVKSWLFTILRNIRLNQLRHERAGPKIAELDSDENLADLSIATSEDNPAWFAIKVWQITGSSAGSRSAAFTKNSELRNKKRLDVSLSASG